MTSNLPELEGYIRQSDLNDIIKARLDRDRKQQQRKLFDAVLDEVRDELRSLRVMVAAIKDDLETL